MMYIADTDYTLMAVWAATGLAPPLAARIQFDRRGNVEVSVKNSKSQIINNKQITMTKIQNDKPVWVIGY